MCHTPSRKLEHSILNPVISFCSMCIFLCERWDTHLLQIYFLVTYTIPGTILDTGDMGRNREKNIRYFMKSCYSIHKITKIYWVLIMHLAPKKVCRGRDGWSRIGAMTRNGPWSPTSYIKYEGKSWNSHRKIQNNT